MIRLEPSSSSNLSIRAFLAQISQFELFELILSSKSDKLSSNSRQQHLNQEVPSPPVASCHLRSCHVALSWLELPVLSAGSRGCEAGSLHAARAPSDHRKGGDKVLLVLLLVLLVVYICILYIYIYIYIYCAHIYIYI